MRSHAFGKLRKATSVLKCLAHPLRLSLLCYLSEAKELTAGQLVALEKKKAGQSQVSQYLGQLRRLKLVKTRRKGQIVYYRLTSVEVKQLLKVIHRHYFRKP